MITVIRATFDGDVFRPSEPVDLAPDTEVRITIEANASVADDAVTLPRPDSAGPKPQNGPPDRHRADLRKLLRLAGSVTSANANSADNDRLDQDLVRDYASRHENER